MTKTIPSPIRWQWIAALTFLVGVLNGLNGRTLLLNPLLGLFLCIMLWFRNRPFTWQYDCLFFGIVLTCAAAAWLISIASCQVWHTAVTGTAGCQAVASPERLLGTMVFVLIPVAILYIATYAIILSHQLRKQ